MIDVVEVFSCIVNKFVLCTEEPAALQSHEDAKTPLPEFDRWDEQTMLTHLLQEDSRKKELSASEKKKKTECVSLIRLYTFMHN